MHRYTYGILKSFPVQLLLLQLKRYQFLFVSWLLLFCFITGAVGSRYGINLLFLDPEYYGRVDFISFFIVGLAFGGFLMVWNLTGYILYARYFSFLATLNRPFGTYCINNAIIPILFFVLLIYQILAFQSTEGLLDLGIISIRIAGLLAGIVVFVSCAMLYFHRTNKDIGQVNKGRKGSSGSSLANDEPAYEETTASLHDIHIEYYLNHALKLKLARSADHYPLSVIRSVYRQHHSNALFIELASLLIIVMLSFLIDFKFFRIPAASSILLLFTILIMLAGAFTYWLGRWKLFFLAILIIIVNLLIQSNLLQYKNKAYGLSYRTTSTYSLEKLQTIATSSTPETDRVAMLQVLENWKHKFDTAGAKPKMVFINCSGGGLRASMFVMKILQEADSATHHKLMQHTLLMTGASGGMLAAAYYRELYAMKMQDTTLDIDNMSYLSNISDDLLNAVGFTWVVNDLFYPWQSFTVGDTKFRKDRGYMFEKALHENTEMVLQKQLADYKQGERHAAIPMLLFSPTILNDERKLYIGTQGFSFLSIAENRYAHFSLPEIDGIDIHSLLAENTVDSLSFASVLRMNCTFPYILPNVHMPTSPGIEVMDAGVRDNYGIQTSAKFIEVFRDWIKQNTSGVIIINIRGIEQIMPIHEGVTQGVFEKFFSPIGALYNNWVEIQDYQNEHTLNALHTLLGNQLEVITFAYAPGQDGDRASLSFHLTAKEKMDIMLAAESVQNREAFKKLESILLE
jgi:hypothetical protein